MLIFETTVVVPAFRPSGEYPYDGDVFVNGNEGLDITPPPPPPPDPFPNPPEGGGSIEGSNSSGGGGKSSLLSFVSFD